MSAVIEKTEIVLPEAPQTLREQQRRPNGPSTRRRTKPKTESLVGIALAYCVKLGIVSFVFVCVSSGVSQYLFEQARHAGIGANARAHTAESALTGLRRDVDRLQSADRIQTWAALNGFTASYLASNEKAQ